MSEERKRRNLLTFFLDGVEKAGNKLPDPVFIFIFLCGIVLLASWICALFDVSAISPADGKSIHAVNLLNRANLARIIEEAIKNFSSFPPLGIVLAVMIGVGVAEKSGWFETLMKSAVIVAPRAFIIPVIVFTGIMGNIAGDAAIIVLPPIAAIVFIRLGYHPIAGIACAYASTLGGFAANLAVGLTDVLALAFTKPAAQMIDANVAESLNAAMNYYFIAASTFLLLIVGVWVTYKVTLPRMGHYTPEEGVDMNDIPPTARERKAMLAANITLLLMLVGLAFLCIPEGALLRNAETGSLIDKSPLMNGVSFIIALLFFFPGLIYAWVAGTAKSGRELSRMMGDSMSAMGTYIVIVFFAAQMLAFFNWSNLGTIIAIKGAELLKGQNGITLIVGIVFLSACVNMLIGSASAKWAILAPIFVPMMMLLDYHPAFTQMVYRVGDSITNPITPMMPYLPLVLSYAQRYTKNIGMGTLIAALMPYSIAFSIFWTLMLIIWYLLGCQLGPGGYIFLTP
ncbi:MAG: AbgT family transporter [Cardiobacteriaceae bacterium]|nr:AbgT family transporter [Cardiobacteriaceae bacterium]